MDSIAEKYEFMNTANLRLHIFVLLYIYLDIVKPKVRYFLRLCYSKSLELLAKCTCKFYLVNACIHQVNKCIWISFCFYCNIRLKNKNQLVSAQNDVVVLLLSIPTLICIFQKYIEIYCNTYITDIET